jgi:hypothetical protein
MPNIPRQLTVEEMLKDPVLREMAPRLEIRLDGVKQVQCTAYDIDAGSITRMVLDDKGKLVIDGEDAKLETLNGRVEVSVIV